MENTFKLNAHNISKYIHLVRNSNKTIKKNYNNNSNKSTTSLTFSIRSGHSQRKSFLGSKELVKVTIFTNSREYLLDHAIGTMNRK